MPRRYCLMVDLKDDEASIQAYEAHHRAVWPAIEASIRDAGVRRLSIYRCGNRLCMIMEVEDDFSFEEKAKADRDNETVQAWETLMWNFQQALPWAEPGEKWLLAQPVYELNAPLIA